MDNNALRLSSVEITAEAIAEIDGNKAMVSLSRDQIASMALQRGIKSERPIVDIVIGILLILLGTYIFWPILSALWAPVFRNPGIQPTPRPSASNFIAMGLVPIPMGIYLILDALRKRYFVIISTTTGIQRKIVFDDDVSYTEIRSFIDQAQNKFGYHIAVLIENE